MVIVSIRCGYSIEACCGIRGTINSRYHLFIVSVWFNNSICIFLLQHFTSWDIISSKVYRIQVFFVISLHWVICLLDKAFSSVKIILGSKKYYTSQVFKCTLKFCNNFIFLFLKVSFFKDFNIRASARKLSALNIIWYILVFLLDIKTTKKFSKLFATIFSSLLNINDLQWEYFA